MSRYTDVPGHPLRLVPDEVLKSARSVLAAAANLRDVDPEMADPIADAVVIALMPWLPWQDPERNPA